MSRRVWLAAGAVLLVGAAVVVGARRRVVGSCAMNLTLPEPVEPYAAFEPAATCDPTPKPGVIAFRAWIMSNVGGSDLGIARACGIGAASLHHEGRAWDWGISTPQAAADLVACFTTPDPSGTPDALARRAGLRHIIYDRRIWIADGKGWRPYSKNPHTDHVHFGFSWAGANGATSLYPAIGALPLPVSDVAGLGKQVPPVRTEIGEDGARASLAEAHQGIKGNAPPWARLGGVWALVMLETGRTKSMWNYNHGNIIRTKGWPGDWHVLQLPASEPPAYRAYPSAHAGAADLWALLFERYGAALARFDASDPEGAAHELHAKGYFTADPHKYGATLRKLFDEWAADNPPPDEGTGAGPLVAITAGALLVAALASRG